MSEHHRISILFVCMGNICRSPMAEGVLRHRAKEQAQAPLIAIDSAGTHGYHVGSTPDERAQAAAARRGIDISTLAARRVAQSDFDAYDLILAMDADNLAFLRKMAAVEYHAKIRLFMDYSRTSPGAEVPDPYYGGQTGFERVLDLIEDATVGLLRELSDGRHG